MQQKKTLAAFARAVRHAAISGDVRAAATNFGSTLNGPDGGFAVPEDMIPELLSPAGSSALLTLCDIVPVKSGTSSIPADTAAPWEDSGIQAYWENEGAEAEQSAPDLDLNSYHAKKLICLVPVTGELAEDTAADIWLPAAMQRAVTWKLNDAIVNGTGVGTLLGILNSDALITVEPATAQSAETIIDANIASMVSRCLDVDQARWILNPDGFAQVMLCSLFDKSTRTLGGLPVTVTEAAQALGDVGDLILANMAGYRVAWRSETLTRSVHLWWDQDIEAFKLVLRLDGAPVLGSPVVPPHSSQTRSHFVTLAARQ